MPTKRAVCWKTLPVEAEDCKVATYVRKTGPGPLPLEREYLNPQSSLKNGFDPQNYGVISNLYG